MRQLGVGPKPLLMAIGMEVRRRRESVHLSQVTLAKRAKLHPNVIGRLERGTYNPTVVTLYCIAAALKASLVSILGQAKTTPRARNIKLKAG
jgi:transcriptional regulator with XRE-family HTH domain